MSQFIYLLNAMEDAAQAADPSTKGYGLKRRAVLEYVEKLEAVRGEAEERDAARYRWLRGFGRIGKLMDEYDGTKKTIRTADQLDAAIDAAMRSRSEGK